MGHHQKRLTAPEPWGIGKKDHEFVAKTAPGPHNTQALPLGVWLRDQMGFALTHKEVKKILNDRQVVLNGKVCKDPRRGIGLFDIVELPGIGKQYLILRDTRGKIVAREIPPEQARTRLCKVKDRTVVAGGKIQLNLRYGANLLLAETPVKPQDSVVITLSDSEGVPRFTVVEHYPFAAGSYAMVIGGKHRGHIGTIAAIEKRQGNIPNRVILEDEQGHRIDTVERYVFVIGTTPESAARWGVAV